MNNYIQPGDVVTLTATGTVSSGDGIQTAQLFAVSSGDALIGETFEAKTTGVFSLPKNAAQAVSEGDLVYWDGTELTTTAATNLLVGHAISDELAATTPINVRLDGVARIQNP